MKPSRPIFALLLLPASVAKVAAASQAIALVEFRELGVRPLG